MDKKQLAQLAVQYGLPAVIRWKPKKVSVRLTLSTEEIQELTLPVQTDNLLGSGEDAVLAQSVYAIVGAIALERGGSEANRVVRERILSPLGLGRGLS